MKKVIIYSQETCPPCHEEKLWLKENGIVFEERDIRKNDQYLQELIELGAHLHQSPLSKMGTMKNLS